MHGRSGACERCSGDHDGARCGDVVRRCPESCPEAVGVVDRDVAVSRVTVLAGLVLAPSEVLADLGISRRGGRNALLEPGTSHELPLAPLLLRGPRRAFGGKRRWRA